MTIYIITIALCVGLYFLLYNDIHGLNNTIAPQVGSRYIKRYNNKNKKSGFVYFILISLMMVAVIGLRDVTIGIDTVNYCNTFNNLSNVSWSYLSNNKLTEPGYSFICILFNKLNLNFHVFLIFMAFLYIIPVSYIIFKYSKSPCFSYILFIAFGLFTFSMSTIRQTMAMSLVLIAFIFMQKRKLIPFIVTVLLAATFHMTAVVFLPAYFLNRLKLSKKILLILFSIGILLIVFKEQIRLVLNSNARLSYKGIETGGNLMYIFLLGTVIIGLLFGNVLDEKNKNNAPFFYMLVAAIIIFPITQFNPTVMRLYFYYSIFMIIYIPNMLWEIKDHTAKILGYAGYILVSIYFMITDTFSTARQLTPYLFFWK